MNDFQNDKKTNDEEISLNISDILKLLANNRWWFVLSSVLCIAIAVLYIMWAPKVYERTATVLIKDDNSKASETALFQDLSIFEGKSNVNNEMIVLKSRSMMEEAVRRLKLDVSYTERKQLRTIELYSTSPVAFAFEEVEEAQTLSFKAKLLPDSMLLLYDLIINEEKNTKAITVKLGDTVGISAGKMVAVASLWS
ncbi:MAG: chromosome partitioning protein ParA, partial [Tannerella sp.]|nr:chromosome partitioning protein ParA [Tannerella sp.]